VSTEKQFNENQIDQLREFVSKQTGWTIVTEYVDRITGSGKKDRAQFEAMMLAASQKKFDLLLFWKLDRFSREGTRKTLQHLTRLDSWGIAWRSFMEPFFDSCGVMKDVVISIMATLAEQERITLSERTKAGIARARKQGRLPGPAKKTLDMAEVSARRAAGESLRSIAAAMGCSASLLVKRAKGARQGRS
jgi:DNA invertase Pin-like site-specific DNA recombinase